MSNKYTVRMPATQAKSSERNNATVVTCLNLVSLAPRTPCKSPTNSANWFAQLAIELEYFQLRSTSKTVKTFIEPV
jgi:hypothetical protein